MNDNTAQARLNNTGSTDQLPGLAHLTGGNVLHTKPIVLLVGPVGAGKTMYCRQFILDQEQQGSVCIYITPSMSEKQFLTIFPELQIKMHHNIEFMNPYSPIFSKDSRSSNGSIPDKLSVVISDIRQFVTESAKNKKSSVCVVVDSLTQLFALFGEAAVLRFAAELSFLLKEYEATALFTLTANDALSTMNLLGSLLDGVLEMKLEEGEDGDLTRAIRMISIKGIHHTPAWVQFSIREDGTLVFGGKPKIALNCTLCGNEIFGVPIMDSEFAFDTVTCRQTYRKLVGIYGSDISDTGLPSQVSNMNFFFVDIVGLSNPTLSVERQIEKIEILNKVIALSDAFTKSKEQKIVLPTGDGMAIGFFLNPESPLQLSIQVQSKLREYNIGKSAENSLGIRIGLSSGPVFIVNDMNGNQNVWGPGIILARRVMDIGDNFHILLSGNMAESLISLKDEYKKIIRPLGDYQIKHGQTIGLFSAYSKDFGNQQLPTRFVSKH